MAVLQPTIIRRDELLDDARFWAIVYEYWLKPRVGDPFDDGEEYFLSVREAAVNEFWRELESLPVEQGRYPSVSVMLQLRGGWRFGVALSLYPEDFEVQDVTSPPDSDELVLVGVNGGNSILPAFRWQEVLTLANHLAEATPARRAHGVLLLYPAVFFSRQDSMSAVRDELRDAWRNSGVSAQHLDEFIARITEHHSDDYEWRNDPQHGWITTTRDSLRNPETRDAPRVLSMIQRMFASLGVDSEHTRSND